MFILLEDLFYSVDVLENEEMFCLMPSISHFLLIFFIHIQDAFNVCILGALILYYKKHIYKGLQKMEQKRGIQEQKFCG